MPTERLTDLPPLAVRLGFAGLLPQLGVVAMLTLGDGAWRFSALALGYAYAAFILSFLGGAWWGLAAARPREAPSWLWAAAVAPSLIALASAIPWAIGAPWPAPSLVLLAAALVGALLVDRRLDALGLCPRGWLALRAPLSLGLGALTLATAFL